MRDSVTLHPIVHHWKLLSHQCLVRDPAKMFLTFKFSCLLLCQPNYKTERGTTNMWKLLIANHLDQSLCLANQKQGALIRPYLLHSSLVCAQISCAFYQPWQTVHGMQEQNRFAELNQHILTFLHLILMSRVIYCAWGMLLRPFSFELTLLGS